MIQINNDNSQNTLNQTDRNFVNLIVNKITLFGTIPYTIPEKMIVEVIKSSARWFYKYHGNSWRSSYYLIKKLDILQYAGCDNFQFLGLTINPEIRVVKEIYQANSPTNNLITNTIDNYNIINDNGSSINNNLYILESVVKVVELRALQNIVGSHLPYDFSPNTHELFLKKAPTSDIILDVYRDNDISSLYNDAWFERHVIANTKRELKRLLAGHVFNLPGNVTMSAEEICNNIEDAEKIEDLVKNAGGIGDIIMKR